MPLPRRQSREVTDQPIDLSNGRNLNVRIVLTDRVTEVTGTVDGATAARDQQRRDSTIVVFPPETEVSAPDTRSRKVARRRASRISTRTARGNSAA